MAGVSPEDIPVVLGAMRAAWPVGRRSVDELVGCLSPCSFPKKYRLVEEDAAYGKAYFIERGMTRSYWIVDGEEITTSFSTEGGIVFSMDELYYGKLSEEYVETIEPVDAFAISLDDLRQLFASRLDLANWGRIIHQNEYRRLHRSHRNRLTLTAKESYGEFCREFPEVCRRAQLGYIASYLGITQSTLSRIRNSII